MKKDIDKILKEFWKVQDQLIKKGYMAEFSRIESLAIELFAGWLDNYYETQPRKSRRKP